MSAEPKSAGSARERELFLAALEKPTPAERATFLDAVCGDDPALRQRLEALLREQAEVGSFLETPALSGAAGPRGTEMVAAVTEKPGDRIGRYRLLQNIGEGGCGVVYMAEQEQPIRRRVALKVIKLGMDTKSVIARFEAERQALAMMDHPNIAKVLDGGATDAGRPFFVMELVRGIRITEYCDQNNLTTEERLKLFIQVCQAIQHAHQKGIIHRDIKPSNILVTLHDGMPVPKVIDFGIAKATEQRLTDKTLFTEFQAFIGTPAYTSPEQAEMSGLDIDTRSDIYSLGVLLYELLTSQTPFDPDRLLRSGLHEMRRIIREEEPLRPSTRLGTLGMAEATALTRSRQLKIPALVEAVRGDLDWIVMKCLEKDRTRRYETANALATDLQRFLNDEPVLARPPSNLYRARKMLHRHRSAFAVAALIAATLVAGAGLSIWQAIRATRAEAGALSAQQEESLQRRKAEKERERAEHEKAVARLNEYVADINLAEQSLKDDNYGRAFQLLEAHRPRPGEPDLRGFEWRYLWQRCQGDEHDAFPDQGGPVQSVAFSPNGDLLAIGLRDKLNIYSARDGRSLVKSLPHGAVSLAFLPDGRTLVSAGTEDWRGGGGRRGPAEGRGPGGGRGQGDGRGFGDSRGFDDSRGFGGGRGSGPGEGRGPGGGRGQALVHIWRTSDWTEQVPAIEGTGPVALSGDGSRLAIQTGRTFPGNPGGVRILDTASWKELRVLAGASAPLVFAPDGKTLATDTEAGVALWLLNAPDERLVLQDSTNLFVRGDGPGFLADRVMAFSPDGKFVVAARNTLSKRGVFVLSVWDTGKGEEVALMPDDPGHIEHTGVITSLAFSPDGTTLATAGMDYSIRLWSWTNSPTRRRLAALQGHLKEVMTVAFAPDGQTLVSGDRGGGVNRWPVRQEKKEDVLAGLSRPLAFSKDARVLMALTQTNTIVSFNLATGESEPQFQSDARDPFRFGFPGSSPRAPTVAFSSDLKTLAQGQGDGTVRVWNTETGTTNVLRMSRGPAELLALSPDGRTLITGGSGQPLRSWDLRNGTNATLPIEAFRVLFSPDGRTLAAFPPPFSGGFSPSFQGSFPPGVRRGPPSEFGATVPPAAQATNAVQLWDFATGSLRTNLVGDAQLGNGAAFSPDGRILATVGADGIIRLWDVATGNLLGDCTGHKQAVLAVAFAPDGKTLASASDDSTLKLWNVASQQELLSIRRLGGSMSELMFSPDGRLLVGARGFSPEGRPFIGARGFRPQSEGIRFYRAPLFSETDGTKTEADRKNENL